MANSSLRTKRLEAFEELKQIIGSIVVSNGNKTSIGSLIEEYKHINGNELPFRQHNCQSVLELIQEMDDSFRIEISDKHSNPTDYLVFCLSDQNTQHLVDLVQNQRPNVDKEVLNPYPNVFRRRSNGHRRAKVLEPFSLIVSENNENIASDLNELNIENKAKRVLRPAVCPLPDSRVIPNNEKLKIMEVMAKYGSLNLCNFPVIYRMIHKQSLDFNRFGFSQLDVFLKQMPELVRLEPTFDGIKVTPIEEFGSQSILKSIQNDCESKDQTINAFTQTTNELENVVNSGLNSTQESNQNHFNRLPNSLSRIEKLVSKQDLESFRYILRRNRNGIAANRFGEEYYKQYRKPFVSDKWGFGSAIEMFAQLSQVFYLKKSENGSKNMDEWLLLESSPELRAQRSDLSPKPKKKRFDVLFKTRVLYIIEKISKSNSDKYLLVEDFAAAYLLAFQETISHQTYGYNSFKELLIELSKELDIDVKERVRNKPFVVYRKKFKPYIE